MAKFLTSALCVAILIPRLAAQVQLATAVIYSDQSCSTVDRGSPNHWAVNLCHPYPVQTQTNGMEHQFGSMIYEVNNSRLIERKFQSVNCSGPEHSQGQLGPMVGGSGNCVPVAGSGDEIYAKSITLNASSRTSFTYKPAYSDQGCSTGYGIYMLGDPISDTCSPARGSALPGIPNTTRSFIQKCDSSDMYVVCSYDSADCSGQHNQCIPMSSLSSSGNCSSRPSTWGSMSVWKGPPICPSKVFGSTQGSTPAPLIGGSACSAGKYLYNASDKGENFTVTMTHPSIDSGTTINKPCSDASLLGVSMLNGTGSSTKGFYLKCMDGTVQLLGMNCKGAPTKVTGSLDVSVSDTSAILSNASAKAAFENAMASEIATVAGVAANYVTVSVSAGRRLDAVGRIRRLAAGVLSVSYVISIPASSSASATSVTTSVQAVTPTSFQSKVQAALTVAAGSDVTATGVTIAIAASVQAPSPSPTPSPSPPASTDLALRPYQTGMMVWLVSGVVLLSQ
jgi:hypothetical protein